MNAYLLCLAIGCILGAVATHLEYHLKGRALMRRFGGDEA